MMPPSPVDAARSYLRRGWKPLPVPYRSKNPGFTGWQNFTVTETELPQHFNGKPQNIGVLLGAASGNLVDVDLDCEQAVALASHFLPNTGAVFGRQSRPRSHWLYVAPVSNKLTLTDPITGKRLAEILTNGQQAIFPGSTHQDTGELIQWYESDEPAHIDAADLIRVVKRLGAAALLACHWPQKGSRQDTALALAGGLLRSPEWSEDQAAHFIEAVCYAAGDEQTRSRIQGTRYTLKKLAIGARATGWPTLARILAPRVVDKAREWLELREPHSETHSNAEGESPNEDDDTPLRVVCMADVEPEQVSWLWHPYIARGKLTILEGDPGLGKSWLTCAIACAVTRGRGLPGAETFEPGNVLMLSAEDGLSDTLRPRLDAVGSDVSRIFALNEPLTFDAIGLLRLEGAIIKHSPGLVIIDPLFAFTGGKVDIHRANECRAISAPLAAIAERHGCAILAVRHLGKSRGGGHALNAGIGSIDFTAAARSVLLVGRDPDDEQKRAIVQTKNNLAQHGEAIGYKLEGNQFFWTGTSDLTAGRILAAESDEGERSAITEAIDFLSTALSSGGRDSKAIKEEARQAGISEATLRRAKVRLKVQARKVGLPGSHYQKWVWELPDNEGAQLHAEDGQIRGSEHLRANEAEKDGYSQHLTEDAQGLQCEHLGADACTSSACTEPLSDEEAELAARLEYMEGLPRAEAERRARE